MSIEKRPLITFVDFLAGGLAGTAQVLIGQPFDIVKVRIQTSKEKLSAIKVTKEILLNYGPLAFYKGTLSPLIGTTFAVATFFVGYEFAKRLMARRLGGDEKLNILHIALAGSFGGFFYTIIACPMELFRIKMQVTGNSVIYSSSIDAARKIAKQQGLKGVFYGFNATAIRELIGNAVWLGVYESCIRSLLKKHNNRRENIPMWKIMLSGSLAGVFFWLSIFPADIIKSRMQGSDLLTSKYKSFIGTGKILIQESGYLGLYKGLLPCVIRNLFASAGNFVCYEYVYRFFKKQH